MALFLGCEEAASKPLPACHLHRAKCEICRRSRGGDLGVSSSGAQYPPIQSGEFLLSRFKAIRKLWGADDEATVSNDSNLVEAAAE